MVAAIAAIISPPGVAASLPASRLQPLPTPQVAQDATAGTVLLRVTGALETGDILLQDGSLYDRHTFVGTAGQTVRIRMESGEFDTYLLLLNPAGEVLAENDDTAGGDRNSTLIYTLPDSGTYTIIANAYDASGRGAYQLIVQESSGSLTPDLAVSASQRYLEGVRLQQQGQPQAAQDVLLQVAAQQAAAGEVAALARTHHALGLVNHELSEYTTAIQYLERSLAGFQAVGDRNGEADALNGLALVDGSQGNYDAARSRQQQALALYREIGDLAGAATALTNLADVATNQGNYETAAAFIEQSLALNREVGNEGNIALNLNALAVIRTYQSQYDAAIALYEEALTTVAAGNLSAQSTLLSNLGYVYGYRGEYGQALDYQQRALDLAQQVGNRDAESTALNNLGLVYYFLGQDDRAAEHFEQALTLARAIGDRQGEGIYLGNLAGVYDDLGQQQRAIAMLEEALAIRQELGDRLGEGETLNNLGTIHDDRGDYPLALQRYTDALNISQALGNRYLEGRILSNVGVSYLRQEQYDSAATYLQRSLTLFADTGDRVAEASALRRLAEIHYQSGRLSEAQATLELTVERLASIQVAALTDAERVALFDTQRSTYMTYQAVLIAQGDAEAALVISEQGRARAFAERLAANQVAEPSLPALTVEEIRTLARSRQLTLVEYALVQPTAEADPQLYIWVVQPTGAIAFRSQAFPASDTRQHSTPLTAQVDQLHSAVGAGTRGLGVVANNSATGENSYRLLYDRLIAPIADLLPSDSTTPVVFIPQDALFQVPFVALQTPAGNDLIEQHTVITAPSIQVLLLTQADRAARSDLGNALVVGNPTMPAVWSPQQNSRRPLPPLPGAQQEAVEIAALLNTPPLIGHDATEQRVKQALPTASLVHLATHGLLEYGRVEDSGVRDLPGAIALSPGNGEDGLLTAAELLDIPFSADLVVLSACDTGRGRITGDGVVGLSRSLMVAGVPSVVVSLWAVPDAPTAGLMTEFYRQLAAGEGKAQALRQAMLLTREQHPHPRDWAAFTLLGNP